MDGRNHGKFVASVCGSQTFAQWWNFCNDGGDFRSIVKVSEILRLWLVKSDVEDELWMLLAYGVMDIPLRKMMMLGNRNGTK